MFVGHIEVLIKLAVVVKLSVPLRRLNAAKILIAGLTSGPAAEVCHYILALRGGCMHI